MSGLSVAHILSSFGMGGQEQVALDLATLQRAAGHRVLAVSLASAPEGPNAAAFRAAGVHAGTVAKKGPSVDPSLPLRLAAFLARERVDVVHTHNPHALVYGAAAAALARAACVHTKHGINPGAGRRMWLRRTASRVVDAYVAVTPTLARVAVGNQECDPARMHVIPNGIDVLRFAHNLETRRRVRAELGIPQDAWVVGTVGRLAPEKNQALLVDAMAPLLDRRRHLVIVGDGPERGALTLRVQATWRAEFVHLTGARERVEDLLAAFDVFALTSRSEGLPLVILEAMAAKLPVLATAVGGIPDLVQQGVTGFLVAAGDRAALTKQLVWLASRPHAALQVASVAQRAVVDRHSMQHMARDYESLYGKIARPARDRTRLPVETAAE